MAWTLFVTVAGWTAPLRLDGYNSREWAEREGEAAVAAFRGGHFWATKLPQEAKREQDFAESMKPSTHSISVPTEGIR